LGIGWAICLRRREIHYGLPSRLASSRPTAVDSWPPRHPLPPLPTPKDNAAIDPIRRFAAFVLLMGLGLGLCCLAYVSSHHGNTWSAIRETTVAAATVIFALWLVRDAPRAWLRGVKDDWAKRKSLQFSMRRMFVVVTIICVEAGLFSAITFHYFDSQRSDIAAMMLLVVSVSTIASGIVLRKPLAGALWGAAVVIAALAWILLSGGRP
jgi:hypothetical protein